MRPRCPLQGAKSNPFALTFHYLRGSVRGGLEAGFRTPILEPYQLHWINRE